MLQGMTHGRKLLARTIVLSALASLALASPAAAKTLVSYSKTGGIAGISVSMTVSDGGSARVTASRMGAATRFALSSAALRGLRRALKDARFSTLKRRYVSRYPVSDGITQVVRYAGRTVSVTDGAKPPERLRKLLSRLNGLASRVA